MNLLNPFHLQVFYGVVRLAKMGCDRTSVFLVLMLERCPFILTFSVSPTYCMPHFLHCIQVDQISCFACDVPDVVLSAGCLAFDSIAYYNLLAAFAAFGVTLGVSSVS